MVIGYVCVEGLWPNILRAKWESDPKKGEV